MRRRVILGVSKDSVRLHKGFREKNGLTFTLLSDQEKESHQAYGVWVEKRLCGRAFMGT